ncbi:MAG: DUF5808 domain-containing protein, partial [Gemmatimonadota bacterium]|nr:DUF5808 domain-containing protein [Gemmatimonadota bacterium]
SWGRGCLMVMASALVVGLTISATGRPLAGNLTGTGILLLLALVLYVRMYFRARAHTTPAASRQADRAAAPLEAHEPKGALFGRISLAFCIVTGLLVAAYAIVAYQDMPARVPTLWSAIGGEDRLTERSMVSVLFLPTLSLVLSSFLALFALLTSGAKLSVREGSDRRSIEAQEAFRAANARLFGGVAVLICVWLSSISVQITRSQLGEIGSIGFGVLLFAVVIVLYMGGSLVWILKRYGQGAARMEGSTTGRPLAGGLADNAHWVLGLFYVDRGDPSLMVEKRFGIGYALNYGNRNAVLILVIFGGLTLSLVALAFIGL